MASMASKSSEVYLKCHFQVLVIKPSIFPLFPFKTVRKRVSEKMQRRRVAFKRERITPLIIQRGRVSFQRGRVRGNVGALWVHKI